MTAHRKKLILLFIIMVVALISVAWSAWGIY